MPSTSEGIAVRVSGGHGSCHDTGGRVRGTDVTPAPVGALFGTMATVTACVADAPLESVMVTVNVSLLFAAEVEVAAVCRAAWVG